MTAAIPFAEIWRGPQLESVHLGHAVVMEADGDILHAWGDPHLPILPRSSSKMIQALPLVESGLADTLGLTDRHLALACASHQGAPMHVDLAEAWLADIGLGDDHLRCGPQPSRDETLAHGMIRAEETPRRVHNNCSGKHVGFLSLGQRLGGGPDYVDPDHPVQRAVFEAWGRMTGETPLGHGIDGCSAPNFVTHLEALARAMARFAAAERDSPAGRLVRAMTAHPELVAGEGRACTALMRALGGRAAVKTGAEGVFIAIVPERRLGIALKIADGATRAAECAMAAILVKLGLLEPDDPAALAYINAPIRNWDGLQTGWQRAAPPLL